MLYYELLNAFCYLESIFCRRDIHCHQNSVPRINTEINDHKHADKGTITNPVSRVHDVTPSHREFLKLPPIVSSSSHVRCEILILHIHLTT